MASGHAEHPGNPALVTAEDVTKDLLGKHEGTSNNFWRVASVFGILLILGIIGFVMRLSDGVSDTAVWGYYAAMFAFILTTAQSAPMVAIAPRIAKAHWRRPISRVAELWTVVGLFNLLLFIPMLWILPPLSDGRRSLWFYFDGGDVPSYSPHIWGSPCSGCPLCRTLRWFEITLQMDGRNAGPLDWREAGLAVPLNGTCKNTAWAYLALSIS